MKILTVTGSFLLLSTFALAESANVSSSVAIQPNQAVIQVKRCGLLFLCLWSRKESEQIKFSR